MNKLFIYALVVLLYLYVDAVVVVEEVKIVVVTANGVTGSRVFSETGYPVNPVKRNQDLLSNIFAFINCPLRNVVNSTS